MESKTAASATKLKKLESNKAAAFAISATKNHAGGGGRRDTKAGVSDKKGVGASKQG